jgi:hypothetical protein
MELNVLNIRCVSQVALLGSVTPNLRAVNIQFSEKQIVMHFYYNENYSEIEDEEAEMVGSELISSFTDCMLEIEKHIYPYPGKIPVQGIFVYHRYEPLP